MPVPPKRHLRPGAAARQRPHGSCPREAPHHEPAVWPGGSRTEKARTWIPPGAVRGKDDNVRARGRPRSIVNDHAAELADSIGENDFDAEPRFFSLAERDRPVRRVDAAYQNFLQRPAGWHFLNLQTPGSVEARHLELPIASNIRRCNTTAEGSERIYAQVRERRNTRDERTVHADRTLVLTFTNFTNDAGA
jgi:hypothetical protein